MSKQRIDRLNSLLKEVIAEVIYKEVKNPHLTGLITVTRVRVSKDLHHGTVYVSIMATTEEEKKGSLEALTSAAGFIAVHASKKVTLRYFPVLRFVLDDSVDKHMKIEAMLQQIKSEQEERAQESHG